MDRAFHWTKLRYDILSFLSDKKLPVRSGVIRSKIGRKRKITFTLKLLYEARAIERVNKDKPFYYLLTDYGRLVLSQAPHHLVKNDATFAQNKRA